MITAKSNKGISKQAKLSLATVGQSFARPLGWPEKQ